MLINTRDLDYMRDAIAMLNAGIIEGTMECPECDQSVDMYEDAHIVYRSGYDEGTAPFTKLGTPSLLICCEGYHLLRDRMNAAQ